MGCKVPGAWWCSVLSFLPRTIFPPVLLLPSPATPPRPRTRPLPDPARPVTSASSLQSQRLPQTALVSTRWCLPERVFPRGEFLENGMGLGRARGLDYSPGIALVFFMTPSWMLPNSGPQFPHCLGLMGGETEPQRGEVTSQGLQSGVLERQVLESDRLEFEASLGHLPAV